jgi:hypothetical protein
LNSKWFLTVKVAEFFEILDTFLIRKKNVFFFRGGRWKSLKEDGSGEDAFDTGGGGATDKHYLNRATTGYFQELIRVRISIVMFFAFH